jgi:rubredoxin
MATIYRRCPACGVVRRARDFKRARNHANAWASRRVVCPSCGHIADRPDFVEAEPPAEAEQPEGEG